MIELIILNRTELIIVIVNIRGRYSIPYKTDEDNSLYGEKEGDRKEGEREREGE